MRTRAFLHVGTQARGRVNVALLMQHATRMILVPSSVVSQSPPSSSTLSHKRYDFRKPVVEHKMCVLIFSTTFVWNISHSKKNLARYHQKYRNVFMSSTRYFCRILMKFEFFRHIFEEAQYQVLFKFVQWEPSCSVRTDVQTDGQTDLTKLTVAFRNFANTLKNQALNKLIRFE
jgi:hypothetical protein